MRGGSRRSASHALSAKIIVQIQLIDSDVVKFLKVRCYSSGMEKVIWSVAVIIIIKLV
jgi:hypothetical protein